MSLSPAAAAAATSFHPSILECFRETSEGLHSNFVKFTEPTYRCHFQRSKEAILEAAKGLEGTALIVGAGRGHDLPLIELAMQFEHIDLVDIDLVCMKEAVSLLPEHLQYKFNVLQADLTGIWQEFQRIVEEKVGSCDEEVFAHEILKLFLNLKRQAFDYPKQSASFVVSSLVSSQLTASVHQYLDEKSEKAYGHPFKITDLKIANFFREIECKHIKDLASCLNPSGTLYFADHFSITRIRKVYIDNELVKTQNPGPSFSYSTTKVQECVAELFSTLNKQNWDWILQNETQQNALLSVKGTIIRVKIRDLNESHYHITALTLRKSMSRNLTPETL